MCRAKVSMEHFEIRYKYENSTYVSIFVPDRKRYHERQNHSTLLSRYVLVQEESEIRSIKRPSFSEIFQYFSLETFSLDGSHRN